MTGYARAGDVLSPRQVEILREGLRIDLERHPDWPDLWNLRGLLEAHEGNFAGAAEAFREALTRNPDYATARWNLEWAELLSGERASPVPPRAGGERVDPSLVLQPRRVLEWVRSLLAGARAHPEHGGVQEGDDPKTLFAALALAAARGGEGLASALAELRAGLPGADELLEAANLACGGRVNRERLALLGRPERLNPGLAALVRRAALAEAIAGRPEEALHLYALAALLLGNRASFLVDKAEFLGRQGREEEAMRLYREAVEANPTWYRAHLVFGYELSVRGRPEEALREMEEAIRLQPNYPDIHYQYGLLLHACARNEEAMQAMRRALASNPGYLVARIALANLLFEGGRAAKAAPHYERVLEAGIDTPALEGRFGYSMHAAGNRDRAEEIFLRAISMGPDCPEVLCLYGMFLAETDRRLEARSVWERALRALPSEKLRMRIGRLLEETPVEE